MIKANLLVIGGPSDGNLWTGLNYHRGLMIALFCTYDYSTRECVERWLRGEWSDSTFTMLFGGIICRNFLAEDTNWIVQQLAITNYVEPIMKGNAEPTKKNCADSESSFVERLTLVRPKLVIAMGKRSDDAAKAAHGLGIRCEAIKHPKAGALRNEWFDELVKFWDEKAKPFLRRDPRLTKYQHPSRRLGWK
jgi:hypothetical protein